MKLTTNPDNPRTITSDAYNKLKRSIQRNPDGLTANKIAHKDGVIISGNQRYRAIIELGIEMKPEWFKDLSGWTQEQIDEWVIQSNISAGEWDWDILANEWDADNLLEWGVDMPDDWGETKELPDDIDEIPEVKTPISKLGDLWLLGEHRVLCGDSTDKTTVELLMDGKKADMVFTDPPYGYSYESNHQTKHKMLKNDDQFLDFLPGVLKVTDENCPIYICAGWQTVAQWDSYIKDKGLTVKNILIWKKNNWSMGDLKGAYAGQYEMIFFAHKGRVELKEGRDRDVWEIDREPPKDHPTTKPVELMVRAINNHSAKSVLDLFLGSGSTLIACEQTDRTCYGLELDPAYVDVIVNRWCKLTGKFNVIRNGEKFTWQNQDQEKA